MWHRIITCPSPGVATSQSLDREPGPFRWAAMTDGLHRVVGACGIIPTMPEWPENGCLKRGQQIPIKHYRDD